MTTPYITHRHHTERGKNRTYQFWYVEFRTADGSLYRKSFDSRIFALDQVKAHRDEKIREVGVMRFQERRGAPPFPEEYAEWAVPHKPRKPPASQSAPRGRKPV